MGIKDRLKDFLKINHISKLEFYRKVHVANGYLDKKGAINSDILCNIILNFPMINHIWLLLGEGNMIKDFPICKITGNTCEEECTLLDDIIENQKKKINSLEDDVCKKTKSFNSYSLN